MKKRPVIPVAGSVETGPGATTPAAAIRLAASILGLATITGCAVGPKYAPPAVEMPTAWKEAAAVETETMLPPDWWTLFEDPELDALEAHALAANHDLQRAMARVSEARALARVSRAGLFPGLTTDSGYSRNRSSQNRAGVPPQQIQQGDFNDHHAGFDLGYELDLWGRVRNANDAARADAAAVAADLEVVLLTLTADVARNHHQIRSLDAEIAVIRSTVALRRDAVLLQEARNRAGLINETDASRARTELANAEAELHAIARSRSQIEHALAVLCGQPPATFAVSPATRTTKAPVIPAGLPSALLQRRPDIVAAEFSLQAANARIGVARAAFFPSISLTGSAGLASAELENFLESGSRVGSFGPGVHLPVFDGGANRASLDAAEARYEQSVATYRRTVLDALREVEDALSDLRALSLQSEAINRALGSSRETAALANERYHKGLSSYLEVVDAQRAALQAERQEARLRGEQAIATIRLAKAIGGGWPGETLPRSEALRVSAVR